MTKESFSAHAQIPQNYAVAVYFCNREICDGGEVKGPIMWTQYRFHYILSGEGTFRTKTGTHHISAGQGFLTCPDQVIRFEAGKDTPLEYLWVGFDGTEVPRILSEVGLTEQSPIYSGDSSDNLGETIGALVTLFEQDKNDKYNILSLFYSAMAQIQTKAIPHRRGENAYVEKALDYIHHNYIYRIRIDDISRYVGLDRTYLFKLFVKHLDTAPQEYLIRLRLQHAANLLSGSKLSTSQIAYSCGFRDSPSFCKHFKARYKISPLAYRKKCRETK